MEIVSASRTARQLAGWWEDGESTKVIEYLRVLPPLTAAALALLTYRALADNPHKLADQLRFSFVEAVTIHAQVL